MSETQDDKCNVADSSASNYSASPTNETERRIKVALIRDNTLRALIRLFPPARVLKDDLGMSIHLELHPGIGNMAVKSCQGLYVSVVKFTDDPYIEALSLDVPENASDKEKVTLVRLVAGQLIVHLEGQAGLVGMGGEGQRQYFTIPFTNSPMSNVEGDALNRTLRIAEKTAKSEDEE